MPIRFRELLSQPQRYCLVDVEALAVLLGLGDVTQLRDACRYWFEEAMATGCDRRQPQWTEAMAVGQPTFLETVKGRLSGRAAWNNVVQKHGGRRLRESPARYRCVLIGEMNALSSKESVIWYEHLED